MRNSVPGTFRHLYGCLNCRTLELEDGVMGTAR